MAAPGRRRKSVAPPRTGFRCPHGEAETNPLSRLGLPELREMLLRQESLLGDRAVVSRLPDGGERVRECAARLRAAVAECERRRSGGGDAPTAGLAGALAGLSLAAAERGRRGAGARPSGAPRNEKRRPEDESAARPPPLRHAPAQLLPLAESVALQARQEEARQKCFRLEYFNFFL